MVIADQASERALLSKLRGPLLGYAVVLITAVAGYRYIEGWSALDAMWMVAITFTTIGYGEVHPLSDAGRYLTLGLIGSGVSLHTYTFTQVTRYFVEGGFSEALQARRRKRIMAELNGHFVVVGMGRLGRELAELLHLDGESVVAIDELAVALDNYEHAALKILGDASRDGVLRAASIERARGLAVATGSTAVNVFVVLSARELNPNLHILTRVDDPHASSKALRAGADRVFSPYRIGGIRMAHALLHPHAARFIEQAEARENPNLWIRDVAIGERAPCLGTLAEANLRQRYGVMVVALRRPNGVMLPTPGPDDALRPGDVAVVAGTPDAIHAFSEAVSR